MTPGDSCPHTPSSAETAVRARQNISNSESAFRSISGQGCPGLEQISSHLCLGLVRLSPGLGGLSCSTPGIAPSYHPSPWLVHGCHSAPQTKIKIFCRKGELSEAFMPMTKGMLSSGSPSMWPSRRDTYVPMPVLENKFPSLVQKVLHLLDGNALAWLNKNLLRKVSKRPHLDYWQSLSLMRRVGIFIQHHCQTTVLVTLHWPSFSLHLEPNMACFSWVNSNVHLGPGKPGNKSWVPLQPLPQVSCEVWMLDFQKCCEPGYTLFSTSGARLPKVCLVLLTDNPALETSFESPTSTVNRLLLKILSAGFHGFCFQKNWNCNTNTVCRL